MTNLQNLEISTDQLISKCAEIFCSTENVKQFGQSIPNPNLDKNEDEICTFDVIKEMSENMDTFDLNQFGMYSDDLFDLLELNGYSETETAINTYNWSSPLSNHIDLRVFKSDLNEDEFFVVLNVHNGYSDVRCGYTLQIGFLVECRHFEWHNLFTDLDSYHGCFTIGNFCFGFTIFSEYGCYSIYNEDLDLDNYDVYIGDFSDCEKWIENKEYE